MVNIYAETRTMDRRLCKEYGLNEDILMENAAAALEQAVRESLAGDASLHPASVDLLVVTGSGDNGGDGMALARRLQGEFTVAVYPVSDPKSAACIRQTDRARRAGVPFVKELQTCRVLADCIFGSGFHGVPQEDTAALMEKINTMDCVRIACDVPSGIDSEGVVHPSAIQADITVCMGALKQSLFSDAAKDHTGRIITAGLGVSRILETAAAAVPVMKVLEKTDLRLPLRTKQNVHKGSFGHAVVVCGEKQGAAVIAGTAALSFGAGLVTLVTSGGSAAPPPELILSKSFPANTTAAALGMGMGQIPEEALRFILENPGLPCVLDADIFYQPELLKILRSREEGAEKHRGLVLTPHPKEFQGLLKLCGFGDYTVQEIAEQRVSLVRKFCIEFPDTVLLLKGANTLIGYGDELYINTLGSNSLAKGGSGDVLSGLICGLLAQGYEPRDAAISASLAHAIASRNVSCSYGMTPSLLIRAVRELGE